MTEKRLVFKGKEILAMRANDNVHQFSLRARVSAMTGYKYLQTPEKVKALDLGVLYALLRDGAGLTDKEMLNLKVSDLFALVEDKQ